MGNEDHEGITKEPASVLLKDEWNVFLQWLEATATVRTGWYWRRCVRRDSDELDVLEGTVMN